MDGVFKKKKPGFLEFAGTAVCVLSLIFQVVSLVMDYWIQFSQGASQYRVGLWRACETPTGGETMCSMQQMYNLIDNNGRLWTMAPQILLVSAAVLWFCDLFLFIKLSCTVLTDRTREMISGVSMGLMLLTATFLMLGSTVFATGTESIPGRVLSWSFALSLVSLFLTVISGILIGLSQRQRSPSSSSAKGGAVFCADLCAST